MANLQTARYSEAVLHPDHIWLDPHRDVFVEVTSEEEDHPLEAALQTRQGWRAAVPGTQTIRLIFHKPQHVRHVGLIFEDRENARTQEFVLRWSSDDGLSFRDIVRQQWNFSVPNSVREEEEYAVELSDVTTLELVIVPDISGGEAWASLEKLHVA